MGNKKILTIIPVRLASSRLPNKPLADILGKTMIRRVYERAVLAGLGRVVIACDGEEIAAEAKRIGAEFVITDPNLSSGTDRIYAAHKHLSLTSGADYDVIVNLQGDLPTIDPKVVQVAAVAALEHECDIATVASVIKKDEEVNNPNVVKIAIAFDSDSEEGRGRALYFSRSPIPYVMNKDKLGRQNYFHHIGIYAYKTAALEKFVLLPQSPLESRESLEQLRALENGMKIFVRIVETHPMSVDTKSDLDSVILSLKE